MMNYFFFLMTIISFSQVTSNNCPMSFTGTDSNATIAITQESSFNFYLNDFSYSIPLNDIQCSIEIGVFMNSDNIICSGSSTWSNSDNFAITVWGDDATTTEIDGMVSGSEFLFGICLTGSTFNEIIFADPESIEIINFKGGDNSFNANGMYVLNSANFTMPYYNENNIHEIQQPCWPLTIDQIEDKKKLILRTDYLGRIIPKGDSYYGQLIEIFDDNSFSKVYRY